MGSFDSELSEANTGRADRFVYRFVTTLAADRRLASNPDQRQLFRMLMIKVVYLDAVAGVAENLA